MSRVFKSTEHAMFVVFLLALQRNHEPIKSTTLSHALNVSDSYLKKTLRKLSVGGIVITATGPGGGIRLAKPADQITLGEIARAMNEGPWIATVDDLKSRSLMAREGVSQAIYSLATTLTEAGEAFDKILNSRTVAELLPESSWKSGLFDWNELVKQWEDQERTSPLLET